MYRGVSVMQGTCLVCDELQGQHGWQSMLASCTNHALRTLLTYQSGSPLPHSGSCSDAASCRSSSSVIQLLPMYAGVQTLAVTGTVLTSKPTALCSDSSCCSTALLVAISVPLLGVWGPPPNRPPSQLQRSGGAEWWWV
jgi:hypothetical protein